MSGCSDSDRCPHCGNDMNVYTDWKHPEDNNSECLYCGYYSYVKVDQMTLEEVNDVRTDCEMELLTKLAPKLEEVE